VIIDNLIKAGAKVYANDPVAMEEAHRRLGDKITYCENQYEALDGADALVIVTEWPEYRNPSWKEIENRLKNKLIFDGRNIYELAEMEQWGWTYYSIGRKDIKK
jgi:UDPglucose 6-dehydrogenase